MLGPFGQAGMAGREAAMARAKAKVITPPKVGKPEIEAAITYGLRQERLSLRAFPPGARGVKVLVSDKWERVVNNAELFLRRQGMIRP